MITINIRGRTATKTETELVTSGSVGMRIRFEFDAEWEHLGKIACFRGSNAVDQTLENDECVIPWEAVERPGREVTVGIYGVNESGSIVIPTVYCNIGMIRKGAKPSEKTAQEATPSAVGQMLAAASRAEGYADQAMQSAMVAEDVKRRADAGEFNGMPGDKGDPFRYEDFTPEQLASLKGDPGSPGYTPVKGIDYFDGRNGVDGETNRNFSVEYVADTQTLKFVDDNTDDRVGMIDDAVFNRQNISMECDGNPDLYEASVSKANLVTLMEDGDNLVLFHKGDKITYFKIKTRQANTALTFAKLYGREDYKDGSTSYSKFNVGQTYTIAPTSGVERGYNAYDLSGIEFEEDCYAAIGISNSYSDYIYYHYDAGSSPLNVGARASLLTATAADAVETATFSMIRSNSAWFGWEYTIERVTDKIEENRAIALNGGYDLSHMWKNNADKVLKDKGRCITFAVQADTHFAAGDDEDTGRNLSALTQRVGFDFVAHLGDIIRGYAVDTLKGTREAYTELMQRYMKNMSCPFLVTLGNHDNNRQEHAESEWMSEDEQYGRTIALSKNTAPSAVFNGRSIYYYMDFDDANIRVIMLYTYEDYRFNIGEEQLAWFRDVALDTDKSVIVMTHVPLISAFASNRVTNGDAVVAAVESFRDNGGTVIGFFYGHLHERTAAIQNGIPHIAFANKSEGTEAVIVNTDGRTIRTISIGRPRSDDRTFTF